MLSLKARLHTVFMIGADGQLYRTKKTSNCAVLGPVRTCTGGYLTTSFEKQKRLAHHVVWAMHHGEWPSGGDIDHINRVRHDNRIENLRLVSRSVNMHNTEAHKDARSAHKGVDFNKARQKWRARICINYKNKQLGYFSTEQAAADAIQAYRKTIGEYL